MVAKTTLLVHMPWTHLPSPLASHSATPQSTSINEISSFRLLNLAQQNFPSSYLIFTSRFATVRVFDQLFTTTFVNKSLVYPFLPYYCSKMTSLGLWRLPFFSLTQSSTIQWNRSSFLVHLTTTLVLQSIHILRPNTPTLLPVLLSFTSTGLKAFLWQSRNNPSTLCRLPSTYPMKVNYLLI